VENSIKEAIERLKLCSTNQCNICGRYEKEECMLERNRCEQHILSEYKKVLKENEELKQDRNNNYQMIALAQNEALGYMQGYEDGKKLKRSAIANIVENQRYYILNEQIEYYKEYIEELRKKNEQLRTEVNSLKKENEELNEKILDNAGIYQLGFKDGEESYIKKVKDKIRKNEEIIDISNDGDLIHELYQKNKVYEELLESEK
jgi:hypothetical protein